MHGYESGDKLVAKHLSIFHTEEQLNTEVIPFNEQVKQRGYNSDEVGHMRKEGSTFPTMMNVTLLKDMQDRPYAIAGFTQDITYRKRAEEKLRNTLGETERVNRLMQGRETRIRELKDEVNSLLRELGRDPSYQSSSDSSDERINVVETEAPPAQRAAVQDLLSTSDHEVVDRRLEKSAVDVAFIPILCSAPLLYAKTQGYFARNGLDVTLTPAQSWSGVKNLLAFGHTDAAHLLSPMPLAM